MKMNLVIFGVFAAAGLLCARETMPQVNQEVILAVHVDNGTVGGRVAEGTTVTVNFYQDGELIKHASSVTDSDGNCIVKDIPKGSHVVAVAQAKHSDMAFFSSPLQLMAGQQRYDISFQVFDVAYDNSLIRTGTHHLIIKKTDNGIHATEYIQLINDSDKAVLSDKKDAENRPEVVVIALPDSFKNLAFSSYFHPEAVVQTQMGFYDTMAIPPGSYHAVFSYDVPQNSGGIEFEKLITLPTDNMMVFAQAGGVVVAGLGEPAGRMVLKDGAPTNYYTVDVSQGSVLKFHLEGDFAKNPKENVWMILGVVFASVVLIALFRLKKS